MHNRRYFLWQPHGCVHATQSGWMHEDHMPKSANFDVCCFLIKFFQTIWVTALMDCSFFEAHEAMFAFSSWQRCVMGIYLLYSSIASTGNVHVKIQLLLVWEGPQPVAVVCMLRMFLGMLNTVMWLIPTSAVSWHLTQPPVCLCNNSRTSCM